MSISPNVGALSSYLNRVMTGHAVNQIKNRHKNLPQKYTGCRRSDCKISQQVEESLKTFVVPGALFEELGFTYVGPLEGHTLEYLINNFKNIKNLSRPVLVHVITKKGKAINSPKRNRSIFTAYLHSM